ncbi:ABC transporter ATP-binding protein [Aerococcus urinae]|uniref:ABC-type quaternary amine transporter n=1 Tax=Aerococcus urinae TaxID=1376 RepID=A0A0X8FFK4_9LACT|nr:ATP-binding cassette domain-containing protein [Aerococcus urinae]AMB96214.1 ABC transporter ATP-binding protein [Aerococcus urinae]MCY3033305.1 ATP-binding cassette domain-containing protein [Aerococcus urinae]MCY3038369.1 ATP-binding cassette domain-containing protein [Aerococcus urinae]MCY3045271.1 ATP-binding cassette domain-containing protein [Aerococcus urinae]MCY3046864.1 ATP-binding cassette domain-containing protein [Aerococcus urinae]
MDDFIRFESVSKIYQDKLVVDHLNLAISSGEFFVLVGPSGSGKTTTLKMINGLVRPEAGRVYFKGQDIRSYNLNKMRWQMGYVLQDIALFPTMTVEENIETIPEMIGMAKKERQARTRELLDQVGLDPKKYSQRYPHELSGGEQQRVGICRAIAAKPPLILMDEPFSALDPLSREALQELLLDLHHKIQTTIVFVTHDMDEALRLGDRIAVMQAGRLVQVDSPKNIKAKPANEFVRHFFKQGSLVNDEPTAVASLLQALPTIKGEAVGEMAKDLPQIDSQASLTELYQVLAQEQAVLISYEGEVYGPLNRSEVFTYLAEEEK